MLACSSGRRRSRMRCLRRSSSAGRSSPSLRATGMIGVCAGPTTSSPVTCTSTSREARLTSRAASGRNATVPVTSTTVSAPSADARSITSGGVHSGLQESWTSPSRSRRSMNTMPPRSRRRWTQPPSRTVSPTWSRPREPARWLRSVVAAESPAGAAVTPLPPASTSDGTRLVCDNQSTFRATRRGG